MGAFCLTHLNPVSEGACLNISLPQRVITFVNTPETPLPEHKHRSRFTSKRPANTLNGEHLHFHGKNVIPLFDHP